MKVPTEIKIINNSYKSELKIKSSRFIGFAFPVENEDVTVSILEKIRKEYYDASHHCYAYKLLDLNKYSDAGEPSGTAGIRILNAIEHFNLVNTLVLVVRYFGGTKLGVGGLGKAYFDSAFQTLNKAEIIIKNLYQKILIKTDFQLTQKVYHLFNNSENKILNVNYSDFANFECLVKQEDITQTIIKLNDLTNGNVKITQMGNIYN